MSKKFTRAEEEIKEAPESPNSMDPAKALINLVKRKRADEITAAKQKEKDKGKWD